MLFKIGLFVFLAGVFAAQVSGTGTTQTPNVKKEKRHKECKDVLSHFVKHKIGHRNIVPENKIHDSAMEICYNGQQDKEMKTCCSHRMERKYMSAAEKDFSDLVQTTSSYLKNLIVTNKAQYEEEFLKMIRKAENTTDTLFDGNLYSIALKDRQPPLSSLFMDLQAYMKGKDVDIHDTVKQFFDDLFPLVFHSILNDPSTTDLNDEYRDCLQEVRQQVYPHPFGELPHNISRALTQAFSDAKLFLDALSIAFETLNTTDHVILDAECQKSLLRMKYCSHCHGYTTVRPCKHFCVNVMRGCLAKLHAVDVHWNKFVDAMQGMVHFMSGPNSIEKVLAKLADNTSAAIMHAMVNTHKFYGKVTAKCGNLQRSRGNVNTRKGHKTGAAGHRSSSGTSHLRLDQRVAMFMRNLQSSKGFYHSLPDTLCTNDQFAVQSTADKNCWNGRGIGLYKLNVTELTLEAQVRNNPEMRVSSKADKTLTAVQEKLGHMTRRLTKTKKSEGKQDDGAYVVSFNYGSGKGQSYGRDDDDDEDYYDNSGSGSGSGQTFYRTPTGNGNGGNPVNEDPDFSFDNANNRGTYMSGKNQQGNSGPKSDPNKRHSSGGASLCQVSVLFAVSLFSIVMWLNG